METKKQIRARVKALRENLGDEAKAAESAEIVSQIASWKVFSDADRILLYDPLPTEADLRTLYEICFRNGKHVALPVIRNGQMSFFEIEPETKMQEGCFHVMEPVNGARISWDTALCLAPGVAFDRSGNRIGYGKGYYDGYFKRYPLLIKAGISLNCQICEKTFPAEKMDVPLDYLVTPQEIISFQEEHYGIN